MEPRAEDGYNTQSHVPYARFEIRDTIPYPQRTHGKLVVRFGGQLGQCSATVVGSENRSVVFTAAHCLRDPGPSGEWADAAAFAPGYRNGSTPFGMFVARHGVVTPQWTNGPNENYDIGALVLRRNGRGQTVQRSVGARGLAWNQSRNLNYWAFGYPIGPHPFTGGRLFACASRYGGFDPFANPNGPPPTRIGCDMTGGSSGGGWVVGGAYVNSVSSYRYLDEPEHLYGPYFGNAARQVWAEASGQ